MKCLRDFGTTASLLFFSVALVMPATQAQSTFYRTTHVTFSGPVEIAGKVLPAGKYTFRLNPLPNQTSIVQILNADGTKTVANLLTIADYRLTPTSQTVVTFSERAGNNPDAVRAWFYPGENFGHEFVYPMKRALQLASANHVDVPAVPDNTADNDLKSAHVTEATPNGSEAEVAQETPPAATTQNPPANSTPANTNTTDDSNKLVASNRPLPKTASDTYSIALLGGLFLLTGVLVGVVRRTVSL